MESIDILLFEEGDLTSGFRTKNVEGDKARAVLIDRGDVLALRACLASVTHGDYTPNGDAATLLVFEFNFLSMKQSRRFKTAKIILTFEDASDNLRNRPEVVTIAPSGKFFINKTVDKRDVHQSINTGLNASIAGVGGNVGYVWDMSQSKDTQHAMVLVGTKRLFAESGKDNGVIWNLEEDSVNNAGIPSFMRAAVLLRRRDDVPFRFTIEVETGVDFEGKLRRMLGLEKPAVIDPVQLDDKANLDDLGIASLDPNAEGVDLGNMGAMDISLNVDVILASLLTAQGQ